MSQSDFGTINPATKTGTQLATDLNNDRDAMQSNHKGSSAPSYLKTGMLWLDDAAGTTWYVKIYDGTSWITIFEVDTSANESTAYLGGSAPSGALGTAAFVDTGTGSSDVPLNSDLGALAALNTVGTSQIDDASVTSVKLASNAVTTAKITDANVTAAKLATGSVTETKIGTGAVTTTKVADDAITLAKQASGTANRLQGFDGSGDPSEVTLGSGLNLSGGTLSSTGGWVLVDSASGATPSLSLDAGIESYVIVIKSLINSSASIKDLYMHLRKSSSSVAFDYIQDYWENAGASYTNGQVYGNNTANIKVGRYAQTASTNYWSGIIWLPNAGSTSAMKSASWNVDCSSDQATLGYHARATGSCSRRYSNAFDEITFSVSGGAISSCDIELWGYQS